MFNSHEQLVSWPAPSLNQVALNVDGSSYGNPGRAGFGGLMRDHNGKWLIGFSGHVDFADSLEVELLAILHGLRIAWDIGATDVSCRSDCTKALSLIQNPISHTHRYAAIIWHIKELISRDWSTAFYHTYRESNQCADFMAKYGANSTGDLAIFYEAPDVLSPLLLSDAKRTPYVRV